MSGPYRFHGDSTRSPLDQPKNVFSSGQPPSFKTNVNRMKTKKWVEAKKNNYDGDDWGDYDEFDEYGADTPPPQPQLPPGVHHGLEQPSRSFTDPHRSEAPAPLYGRRNSFEAGEEHRAFSATHSGYGTPSAPPEEQVPLHAGQRHPSGAGSDASDTLHHRRDFTPSAMPPPLQTRMSPPPSARSPTSANKRLPFIRPADIYKRVEEERQRERTSMDSSRPSLDSLTSRPREEAGLAPSADEAKSPVTPQKGLHPLETVAERKSEYLPDFNMGQQAQQAHQVQAQPSAPVEPIVPWSSSPGHRLSAFDNDFWSSGPRLDAGAGFGGDASRSNDPELRSVVDQAFTRPDDPRSVPPTPVSKPSDTDVSRSNTTSTTGISPIMSRVPSSATAPLKSQNVFGADGSTPVIAEEVSETTTPVSRPTSTAIRADSYQFPHVPAGAHSRNISASSLPQSGLATPTRADSPARSPAIEPQRTVPEPEAAVLTSLSATSMDSPTKDTPTSPETYATREADIATAMRASPDKPASELGAAEKESQRAFLESHVQSPIDTDTPRSRSQSPSKGRVHDLASKFGGVSHSRRGSTQSNVSRSSIQSWERSQDNSRPASPTKPASPERPPVIHNLSFRPKLPGQWESFATTVATPSEPGEKDATAAEPPLELVAPPSPLNEVDLTPTTTKHPVPVTEPTKSALDPLAALKEAGAAIGEAIKASVGVGESSSNDSDDNDKSDGKIDENTERYVEIGGVYLSRPLHIERKASSIASSIPPTPPAKDVPQSEFPPPPPLKETSPEPPSLSPLDRSLRPPMIPQLSTAPSDNDTESDRLRKEIVASLSPVASSETIASDNRKSLQPLSSNLNRESSILPSEYDSYWSDREQLSPQTSRDSARDNFVLTPPSDNQPSQVARPAGGSPGLMPRFSWEESSSQLASDQQVRPGANAEGSSRPQNASTEPTPTEHQKISQSPGQQSLGFPDTYFGPEHTAAAISHEPDLTVRGRDSEKSIRSTTEPKTLKMSSPVSGLHVVNSATNPEAVDMPARLSIEGARNDEPPEYNQAKSALDSDKPHLEQQHPRISNPGPETPAPVSSSPAAPAAATPASVPAPQPGSQSATVDNHKPLGFRDIANIKSASERIATYTSTREYWAHADHGLADWLGSTLASHPEMHATQPLAVQIPIAPIASVRHRHTGSVGLGLFGKHHASASKADLTSPADESGGQTPGGQPGGQMAGGAGQPVTRTASFQIRETRGQMQAKGKDLLHSAGLLGGKGMTGAKGLFAKGKSRFGRSEKDPDAEPDADAHASRPSTAASSRAASPSGLDRPREETGPETISGFTPQPIPITHGPEMHIHELDGRILDTPAPTTPKQNSSKLDIDIVAEAVASNNNHKNNDEENQQESWMGAKASTKANTKKKRRNTDDGAGAAEGRKRRATRARSGSGYYGDAQVRPREVGVEMEHPLLVPMPLPVFLQVSGETATMGPAAPSGVGEAITSGAQEEDKSEELALPHVPAPAASAALTPPMEDLVTGSTAEMVEGEKKDEERKEQKERLDERDEESEMARSLVLREVDSARESGVQESESAGATLADTSELVEASAPLDTLGDSADGDSEELGIGEPASDAEIGAASTEEVDETHDDSAGKEEEYAGSVVSDVPVASENGDGTTDNIVGDLGSEQADEDEPAQGPQLLNPGYFEDCNFEATQEADKLTRGGCEVDETGGDESPQLPDTPSTTQSEVASPQYGDNFESSRTENEGSEDVMAQELDSETTRPNDTARDGTGAVLQGEVTASPHELTISQRQAQIILTSDIYGGPAHATTPATRQDVSPMMPPTEPWDASIALHHAGKAQEDVSRQEEAESPVIPPEDDGDTSSESTQDGSGSEAACRSPSSNHERTIGGSGDSNDDKDDDDDKPPQLNHDPIPLRGTHDSFDISPLSSPKITHFPDSVRNAVTPQRPPEHRMQGMPKRHTYSPTQPQLVVITSGGFKKGASMAKSAGDTGDKTPVQTRTKYNLHAQRSERPPYETMVIGAGDVSPVSTRADHSDETPRQRFAATKAPHALSQSGQGAGAERECSEAANQRDEIATPLARERLTTPRLPSTSYAVRAVEYKPSHSSFESWEQESAAAPSQTDGSQLGDAREEFEHAIVPDPIPRISSPSRDPALPERVGDLASAHHHTLRTVNDSPEPQHPNLPHEGKQEHLLGAESAAMSGGLKHSQSLLSAISSAVSADGPLISPASSQTEKSRPSSRARQLQSSPVKVSPVVSQISEDSVHPEQEPFRPHSKDDFDLYADQNGDVRVGGQNVRVTRTSPPTLQTPQTPPPAANSQLHDTGEARVEEDNQKRYSTDRPMSFISSPHDESGMPQDQINSASNADTPASNPPSASPQGQAITFNGAQPATPPQGDGPAPFITENKPATSPQRDGSASFNTELQSPFSPQLQHGQRISPPDNALGPQHHPSARTVSPLPHPNASAQSQPFATQGHPQPPMVQSPSPQNSMSADPIFNASHQEDSMFQDPRLVGPSGPLHQGLPTHSNSEGQGFVSPHGIPPSQHNPGSVPTLAPIMNHQFQEQGRLQPTPGFVPNGPQYQPSPMGSQPVATPPVRAEDKHRKLPSLFKGLTHKTHPTHHDGAGRADINANQNDQAMGAPVHHPPYQSRPANLPAQQDLALNQGRPSGYAPAGKRPESMGGESHISHISQVSHLSQESMRVQAAGSRLDLQQSTSPAPFQGIPPQHPPPPGAPIRPMPQTQVYNSSSVPEAALPGKKKRFSALGALFGRSKEEKKAQKAQRHVSALPTIPVGQQQWPPRPQQQQYVPVQQQHQQQQQLQQQQQVSIHQQQMPVHQHKNGMQSQPMPGQQNGIPYGPGPEQQSVPLNRNLRSHPTPGHFVSPSAPTNQLRPGVQTAPSVGYQQPPQPQSVSQKPMDEQSAFQAARQNYLMQQRHEGQQSAQPRPQPSPHGGPPLSPPSAPHHEQSGRRHPPGGYFNPGTKQPPVQSAAQTPPHAQRQVVPHLKQSLAPEKPPNMRHVSSPGPQTHAPPPTQRRVTAPLVEPQYETPRIPAAYSQVSGAYVSPSAQTPAPTAWPAAPSSAAPARQHSDPQMQPLSPQVSALSQPIAPQRTHSSSVASAVSSMSSPSPSTTPTNQARLGPSSQRTQPPRMTSISESAPSERPWHMNIPPGATEQDIIRIRHQQYIEQQLAAQQQQQAERKSPPPRQRHHTLSPSPQHQFQQAPHHQAPANTPAGFRELLPRNSQEQPAAAEYRAQGFEQQPPRHQSPHRESPHMQHAQSPPASAYPLPKSPEVNTPVNPLAAAIAPPPPPKIPHTPMNANFPDSQQPYNVMNPYFPPGQSPNTHSAPHPQHPHQHMEDKSMDYGPPPPADSLDHAYEDSTPDEPPPSYSGSNTLERGADKQGQVPSISSSSERHRPPNILIHDPDTERRFRPRQPSIGLLQHPQPASMAAPSSPVDMGAEVLRLQMLEQEHRAHAERLAKEATQRAAAERERVERERARARARELEQSVSRGGRVGSLRSVAGSRAGRPPGWERRGSGNLSGGAAPVARPVFELPAEEDDEPVMRATSFPGQEWVPTFVDD